MPLYEYQCPTCGRFEVIRKFSDPPLDELPDLRRGRHEARLRARHPVQGDGLVRDRLRQEVRGRRRRVERAAPKIVRVLGLASKDSSSGSKDSAAIRIVIQDASAPSTTSSRTALPVAAAPRSKTQRSKILPRRKPPRATGGVPPFVRQPRRAPDAFRGSATSGTRGRARPGRGASGRTRPWPSGSRACCRRRGGRPRSGSRRARRFLQSWRRPFVSWISPPLSRGVLLERREDVGGQDVAPDDGEVAEGASSARGFSTRSLMRYTRSLSPSGTPSITP